MLIEHILATKGRDVVSLRPDATVADAVRVLRERRIGAVIVSDDDGATASGILSERDVVRALAEEGAAALDRAVAAVMTAEVHTCEPSATLEDLMEAMTARRIRHIPVVSDGRLVGVVSIGDVVKHRLMELSTEARALHEYVQAGR